MPPKKRRRAWEDASDGGRVSDSDGDGDPFGLGAAAAEERAIAARRARLRAAPKVAPPAPPESAAKRPEAQQTPHAPQAALAAAASPPQPPPPPPPPPAPPLPPPTTAPASPGGADGGRELRAALLQLRDAPEKQEGASLAGEGAGKAEDRRRLLAPARTRPPAAPAFDMFADTPEGGGAEGDGGGGARPRAAAATVVHGADDAADADGYARLQLDEALDGGRYLAGPSLGQGVFASVYRATVAGGEGGGGEGGGGGGRRVAVKVLRNNDVMRRAGRQEVEVLQRIVDADPDDRRHCVRMLGHFEHRGHSVIVFEEMAMNLRDVVKRFGGGGGIRLAAVRLYASQLLRALHLLGQLGIVHADIKPDNALVSADKGVVKLCDFGSAMDEAAGETDATPYLVSRFYRAPEVILGVLPYTRALDTWSLGCVLYELYTGRIAFPGRSNNDMLRLVQEQRGAVPGRLTRRAAFRDRHYDDAGRFLSRYVDAATGADAVRAVAVPERAARGEAMRDAVLAAAVDDDDRASAPLLADLLDAMLVVDPAKRVSAGDALKMPLFARVAGR